MINAVDPETWLLLTHHLLFVYNFQAEQLVIFFVHFNAVLFLRAKLYMQETDHNQQCFSKAVEQILQTWELFRASSLKGCAM